MNKKPITIDVINCARCGGNHRKLKFSALSRVFTPQWTHWAACPKNKQPIMLKVIRLVPGRAPEKPVKRKNIGARKS